MKTEVITSSEDLKSIRKKSKKGSHTMLTSAIRHMRRIFIPRQISFLNERYRYIIAFITTICQYLSQIRHKMMTAVPKDDVKIQVALVDDDVTTEQQFRSHDVITLHHRPPSSVDSGVEVRRHCDVTHEDFSTDDVIEDSSDDDDDDDVVCDYDVTDEDDSFIEFVTDDVTHTCEIDYDVTDSEDSLDDDDDVTSHTDWSDADDDDSGDDVIDGVLFDEDLFGSCVSDFSNCLSKDDKIENEKIGKDEMILIRRRQKRITQLNAALRNDEKFSPRQTKVRFNDDVIIHHDDHQLTEELLIYRRNTEAIHLKFQELKTQHV